MQESSGSIDIKEERKLIPEKNVEVMPVEEFYVTMAWQSRGWNFYFDQINVTWSEQSIVVRD